MARATRSAPSRVVPDLPPTLASGCRSPQKAYVTRKNHAHQMPKPAGRRPGRPGVDMEIRRPTAELYDGFVGFSDP
jgi:hypothetical protein